MYMCHATYKGPEKAAYIVELSVPKVTSSVLLPLNATLPSNTNTPATLHTCGEDTASAHAYRCR